MCSIHKNSSLVQVMAWHRRGHKLLLESILKNYHRVAMNWILTNIILFFHSLRNALWWLLVMYCKRALSISVTFGSHPDRAVGQCASRGLESADSRETRENLMSSHDGFGQQCLSVHITQCYVLPRWTQDIGRTSRQPNYPNQLAPKRGSERSFRFGPQSHLVSLSGNLPIVQARDTLSRRSYQPIVLAKPLMAPWISYS